MNLLEVFVDELRKMGVGASLDVEGYAGAAPGMPGQRTWGKLVPVQAQGEVQHPEKPSEELNLKRSLQKNVNYAPLFGGLNVR